MRAVVGCGSGVRGDGGGRGDPAGDAGQVRVAEARRQDADDGLGGRRVVDPQILDLHGNFGLSKYNRAHLHSFHSCPAGSAQCRQYNATTQSKV